MEPARTRARATLYAVLLGAVGMALGGVAAALLSRQIPSSSANTSVATPVHHEAAPVSPPPAKNDGLVVERK